MRCVAVAGQETAHPAPPVRSSAPPAPSGPAQPICCLSRTSQQPAVCQYLLPHSRARYGLKMYLTASKRQASCLARYLGKIPDRFVYLVGLVYKFSATRCHLQSNGMLNMVHHFAAALATKEEIVEPSCDQLLASAAERKRKILWHGARCVCRETRDSTEQSDNVRQC